LILKKVLMLIFIHKIAATGASAALVKAWRAQKAWIESLAEAGWQNLVHVEAKSEKEHKV
jgi:hypothetical protein